MVVIPIFCDNGSNILLALNSDHVTKDQIFL